MRSGATRQRSAVAEIPRARVEPIYRAKAKERQQEHGGTAPGKTLRQKSAQVLGGKSNEELARIAGVSRDTIAKIPRRMTRTDVVLGCLRDVRRFELGRAPVCTGLAAALERLEIATRCADLPTRRSVARMVHEVRTGALSGPALRDRLWTVERRTRAELATTTKAA